MPVYARRREGLTMLEGYSPQNSAPISVGRDVLSDIASYFTIVEPSRR